MLDTMDSSSYIEMNTPHFTRINRTLTFETLPSNLFGKNEYEEFNIYFIWTMEACCPNTLPRE